MENTISISDCSILTGLSQKQLRTFETRGYINPPERITCGEVSYRRYNPENIRNLEAFKKFIDEGYTHPVAAKKALEELKKEKN
ncbi:MAG: MerR family transcriptional regulator [Desulfobacula sp.]|jgi:DNA-binding transcriptional MerR regulator|nr:MerR family transcriptional regulator [Desulfobacula sp.]